MPLDMYKSKVLSRVERLHLLEDVSAYPGEMGRLGLMVLSRLQQTLTKQTGHERRASSIV